MGGTVGVWHRRVDRIGAAFVSNGISRDRQRYLALGGLGLVLGDVRLDYAVNILKKPIAHCISDVGSLPLSTCINNPGYDRDGGRFSPIIASALEF